MLSSFTDSSTLPGDLAYGAVGSGISFTSGYVAMKGTESLLEQYGLITPDPETHYRIFEILETISNEFMRGLFKTAAVMFIVFIMPIAEEWFFRDLIYKRQELGAKENSIGTRAYRVISNGVIFGAFHFHPGRGFMNIPLIVASTVAGIGFATLREMTGNPRASTIAHILNSSILVGSYYFS